MADNILSDIEMQRQLNATDAKATDAEEAPAPIDSIVDVEIDDGGHTAKIRMHSPLNGGLDITREKVDDALRMNGVVFGINDPILNMVVKGKSYDKWHVVARCQNPENGRDGSVTYLFEKTSQGLPAEDSKGFVDYKNIGTVRNITKGTAIATIVKETKGIPGISVTNEPIKALDGNPPHVTYAENIELSDDGLSMIATADGNLVWKSGRFSVETVVKIDGDIDISTGNIDFVGDITIRGDVKEGFIVSSGKNIVVQGGVFSSNLTAGGKITIHKGAIGSTLVSGRETELDFAENSNITCSGTLTAKSLFFCDVYCKGEIFVNKGAGTLIGGKTVCTKNLTALSIGSKSYTKTFIVIGENAILLQEKTTLLTKCQDLCKEEEKCVKIVEFLTAKKCELGGLPKEKMDYLTLAAKSILMYRNEKEQNNKRIAEIDDYLLKKQNLSVTCQKELYPGTHITINDAVLPITTLYQYCRVGLGEDGVEIKNL